MRVIINANDYGLNHEANLGVSKAFEEGLCTQATLVVNTDFTDEAVAMIREAGNEDLIGLHINLSEGKPLSYSIRELPKYVGEDGTFHYVPAFYREETPAVSPLLTYKDEYQTEEFAAEVAAVREEIDAQVTRFQELGFRLSHVDSHKNVLIDLPVWLAARPVLEVSGFRTTRCTYESFSTDDIYNRAYRLWINDQRKRANLASSRYCSSVATFLKHRSRLSAAWFAPGEPIEIYIDPLYIDGELVDGCSNHSPLGDIVGKVAGLERATFFEFR